MYIVILYGSILLHEFGHAWGNRLVGGSTDTVYLTPVGGLCVGYGGDSSPKAEIIVVGLGPAVSILLCIIGYILMISTNALLIAVEFPLIVDGFLRVFTSAFFYINLALTLFNLLLPMYPLDSSKLIRAILSFYYNPQVVSLWITRVGIVIAICCLVVSFTPIRIMFIPEGGLILGLIGIMGIQACLMEQRRIQFQDVYTKSDNWGGRQVYYDSDIMSFAKRTAAKDLGPFGGAFEKVADRKKGPKGTIKKSERVKAAGKKNQKAKVIDISLEVDPDEVSDMETLNKMMKAAAEQEEYKLAAKIKKRIREVQNS